MQLRWKYGPWTSSNEFPAEIVFHVDPLLRLNALKSLELEPHV